MESFRWGRREENKEKNGVIQVRKKREDRGKNGCEKSEKKGERR